ncbi:alkaline phosphatase family protein [Tolypothrix sp. PCC 7910]|uniref:alkaline phosphatase family protein n=1 Tax=Tolypothrix sp. PCC 7910 TaxID=2099387 RepID=UPI0014277A15|nr:nucleotide pyrophosphatase/phosphodiesterase family protein [Tolypothrix sp. PCC 7910]QIR37091.1 alkaline phosphatase family protein [Tolypothrix sp. PCC 7910]
MNNSHKQLPSNSSDFNKTHKNRQHWIKRRLLLGGLIVGMSAITVLSVEYLQRQSRVTLADTTVTQKKANPIIPGQARLNLVLILDGLRPDSINPQDTPNLYRLRQQGVNYVNGHSVFPTVTRVNVAAIATGYYPGKNGIVSNSMYVPQVNPTRSFNTGDYPNLLKLDEVTNGKLVFVKTLGERLQENGMKLAAVSSGSTGSALLLNPRAISKNVGILINGYFDPGKLVAFPADVNREILARFGAAPANKDTNKDGQYNEAVDWTQQVLKDYVIPELKPDVIFNWLTEPDNTQHQFGAGSPEGINTIRNDDRNIGLLLEKLKAIGLYDRTNIFVLSDHGFSVHTFAVNLTQELINAGLKLNKDSDDVVLASSGQAVLLHVKDRNPQQIERITKFLQKQSWGGVLFTSAQKPNSPKYNGSFEHKDQEHSIKPQGWVAGTFSLELIHEFNQERGADILLTFPWTSQKNAFGIEGTDYTETTSGTTGPLTGNDSGHGSMSPWNVRNTFIAWGVDFKRGVTIDTPASNVDITPTILALKGINNNENFDGRVLLEGLNFGSNPKKVKVKTKIYTTSTPEGYTASIQISELDNQRYIDKSWRER